MRNSHPSHPRQPSQPIQRSHNSQRGNTLVGLFVGLVLGVLLAAGTVWYLNRSHSPFQNRDASNPDDKAHTGNPASGSAPTGSPDSLPARPGEKERFDFYNILPGGKDATPTPAATAKQPPTNATATASPPSGDRYFLQAGAFQKKPEAENMKAQLALIGIEANVQEAVIQDKGKLYRVRSGPYNSAEEMNHVRTQMSQSGIQATLVKTQDKN